MWLLKKCHFEDDQNCNILTEYDNFMVQMETTRCCHVL